MTSFMIRADTSASQPLNASDSAAKSNGHTLHNRSINHCPNCFKTLLQKFSAFFSKRNSKAVPYCNQVRVSTPRPCEQLLALRQQKSAEAYFKQGVHYETGQGVPQDARAAVACYRTAAGQGLADAQCKLGEAYAKGIGVEQDTRAAVACYQNAARQGSATAQCKLGEAYEKGLGVKQDPRMAVLFYQLAASQGLAGAQCKLGEAYEKGIGVKQDPRAAVTCYRTAAGLGLAAAQYKLGEVYEKGIGVEQDYPSALTCYQKAAHQGVPEAKAKLALQAPQVMPESMHSLNFPTRAAPPPPAPMNVSKQANPQPAAINQTKEVQPIPPPPPMPPAASAPGQQVTHGMSAQAAALSKRPPIPPSVASPVQEHGQRPSSITANHQPQDALLKQIREGVTLRNTSKHQNLSQVKPAPVDFLQELSSLIKARRPAHRISISSIDSGEGWDSDDSSESP